MKLLFGFLFGVLAVLAVGAVGVFAAFAPADTTPSTVIVQTAPPAVPPAAADADSSDMILTLSERFLNEKIAASVPAGAQVQNAQLDLHTGNLADFSATIRPNLFLNLPTKATIQFAVENGRVSINFLNVQIAGFGVPSSLVEPQVAQTKSDAENELNLQFGNLQATSGLRLQGIATTESNLTLYFAP